MSENIEEALKAELSAIRKVTNLVKKLPPATRVKVLKYVLGGAEKAAETPPAETAATKG